jgi:hypothetical protein
LVEQIAAKQVRVRWRAVRPASAAVDDFWQGSLPTLDFADNSATKLVVAPPGTVVGVCPVTLLGVEVMREDIEALQPGALQLPAAPMTPKECFARLKDQYPRQPGEDNPAYAERLYPLMRAQLGEDAWRLETLKRRVRDK